VHLVRRGLASTIALVALLGASCGSDDGRSILREPGSADESEVSEVSVVSGAVTVFAAASLTAAFGDIGDAFMAEHPQVAVTTSFAASSDLVAQIGEGAPADVFASADLSNMAKLTGAGDNATDPVVFATNTMEIITAAGNPKGIDGVADLVDDDLIVVTCAPEVPCGKYAAQVFDRAGVLVTAKSLEQNVKAVATKVILGEADAGIVYRTDVTAAGDSAAGVVIPADINVAAEYPIAITENASNVDAAQAFVDVVLGDQGQSILASYGFLAP
jgi:molybdate transport system substrate-binding protein